MEEAYNTVDSLKKKQEDSLVHRILAHSYFLYFFVLVLGVVLDLLFPIRIFHTSIMMPVGFVVLVLASILIFWAQHTSRKLDPNTITKESFCKGPYCYTRMPTHYGLFLLMLGFGFIANAFFIIVFTILSFVVTRITFVKEQEKVLENKYGEAYKEYKKIVKF
ncbi:MAG: hypothetical protein AAB438_03075 [Patescibacteria group bacterium]